MVFAIRGPIVMIRVGRAFFRMAHAEIISLGMMSIPMLEYSTSAAFARPKLVDTDGRSSASPLPFLLDRFYWSAHKVGLGEVDHFVAAPAQHSSNHVEAKAQSLFKTDGRRHR
jgi:hypothetical protein